MYIELNNQKYNINHTEYLELYDINGLFPDQLCMLKKLRVLKIRGRRLIGSISPKIKNLKQLTHLDLSNNQLQGDLPDSICDLNKIWYINLTNNLLAGNMSESILEFVAKRKLPLSNIVNGNNFNLNSC